MSRRIHRLYLPIEFPAGIALGEGRDYNHLTIARDGQGRPVLRGTALAGALRHAYERHLGRTATSTTQAEKFFGVALPDAAGGIGQESRLIVGDFVLNTSEADIVRRTHHLRNRHSGSVLPGGLFSLEACPPRTKANVTLWLRDDDDSPDQSLQFLRTLVGIVQGGLTLGGNAARGLGLVRLRPEGASYHTYHLDRVQDAAAWLDDYRQWRMDPQRTFSGEVCRPAGSIDQVLHVQLQFTIPRGQDLLIADGQGLDYEMEPQYVKASDGRTYWRLPGASLRGLFRSWFSRLAAREGWRVADSVRRQKKLWSGEELPKHEQLNGDNLGWCFLPTSDRKHEIAKTDCPIASLFGSLFQAGRIHIADAYAPCSRMKPSSQCSEEQMRMHVAVDRLTGGAAESMLFDNTVLCSADHLVFPVELWIHDPQEHEVDWLWRTVRALDVGVLRVGSSKSSGRLCLAAPPRAEGPFAERLRTLEPFALKRGV